MREKGAEFKHSKSYNIGEEALFESPEGKAILPLAAGFSVVSGGKNDRWHPSIYCVGSRA